MPTHHIPSDDTTYALDIQKYVQCIEKNYGRCWPSTSYNYTKPGFILITGILYYIIGKPLHLTPLDCINLLSFLSLALIATFFQIFIINAFGRNVLLGGIPLIILYTNITVLGNITWWGYSLFKTLIVISFWLSLWNIHRIYDNLIIGNQIKNNCIYFIHYFILAILLVTLGVYTNLSSIPFLVVGYFFIVLFQWGKSSLTFFPQLSRQTKFIKINKLLFLLVMILNFGLAVNSILWVENSFKEDTGFSYFEEFEKNLLSDKTRYNNYKSGFIYHLKMFLYYPLSELPLLLLGISASIFIILSNRKKIFLLQKETKDLIYFFLCCGLLSGMIISFSPFGKILRLTFPFHMSIILGVSFLVSIWVIKSLLFIKLKHKIKEAVISLVVCIFFGFNYLLTSYYMNLCFSNNNNFERVIDKLLNKSYWNRPYNESSIKIYYDKSGIWNKYLSQVSIIQNDYNFELTKQTLANKFSTSERYNNIPMPFHLFSDNKSFMHMQSGNWYVTEKPFFNKRTIKREITHNLTTCQRPPVLDYQGTIPSHNYVLNYWENIKNNLLFYYGMSKPPEILKLYIYKIE